ncbi:MAG: alpha/beta fold hydrolase [Renibacterium salmoninarum]|nr:alpha/beta fold hydrolase [Renibacterium salmoninarum]
MSRQLLVTRNDIQLTTTSSVDDHQLPWLVMLHGLGCSKRDFRFLMDGLGEQFNCLALDLPGHGGSGPADRPGLDALAEAVVLALDEVFGSTRFAVLGHSMGGLLGLKIAALLPNRIVGLAILDSNLPVTRSGMDRNRAALRSHGETDRWTMYLDHMVRSWGALDGSPEEREVLRTASQISKPVALRLWSEIRKADGAQLWSAIRYPVLYLRSSREIELAALEAANAQVESVDMLELGLGHWPHVRAPEEVLNELRPFLLRLEFGCPESP